MQYLDEPETYILLISAGLLVVGLFALVGRQWAAAYWALGYGLFMIAITGAYMFAFTDQQGNNLGKKLFVGAVIPLLVLKTAKPQMTKRR